jgi:hypothetical protein
MTGKGKVDVNLELVHFNKRINSDDAIAELKRQGLRPATLWELLAFGSAYKEKQREFPIVALGSIWRDLGDRHAPCLWSNSDERYLYLYWYDDEWYGYCRFAVVRES